jgi:pimeloyl-ACP methyl ester carboxylesterase
VRDWLTMLGIHSAVFVGHSMGSAIAISLALDYPERVNGLVLVGAGARLKVSTQLMEAAENSATYFNAVKLAVDWSFSAGAPQKLKEIAASRMVETRQSVLYGDFRACNEFDETARVNQIRKPTLILCGAEDKMTPPRYSQFLAEQIPGAELEVISEAGHMVQLEQPRRVSEAIQGFIAGIHYL